MDEKNASNQVGCLEVIFYTVGMLAVACFLVVILVTVMSHHSEIKRIELAMEANGIELPPRSSEDQKAWDIAEVFTRAKK